jgi:hypothetical protein
MPRKPLKDEMPRALNIDLRTDARIDNERGLLILGPHELDLRILGEIVTSGREFLWRFYDESGVIKIELVEYVEGSDKPPRTRVITTMVQ